MKILLPVNEKNVHEGICPSFGRAPYFLVWDTHQEEKLFYDNPGASSAGGAGIAAAQKVADLEPERVLTPRLGKNSADVIEAAGIPIYKSVSEDIAANVQLLNEGKLEVLEDIHPGFHNHG